MSTVSSSPAQRTEINLETPLLPGKVAATPMKPSALYRSELWRAALLAARVLPRPFLNGLGVALACGYCMTHAKRRNVVEQNLLPAVNMDGAAAAKATRQLYREFGLKLADLWRYEAGCRMPDLTISEKEWGAFHNALNSKRGVLLLTAHIGNWELGAPFLKQRGVHLQVITQAEPEAELTALRENSRARWGIETLVIGQNPFAFVEVIRRLQSGAVVALLMDRPPPNSAASVQLFGQSFSASVAAAELARATGCAILPVALPRVGNGYRVEILPQITYQREALGSREARVLFTQEMMGHFEPLIREHLTQWYHFVPIWKENFR